jgi:hypothetical protein
MCNSTRDFIGVFVPDNSQFYGAPVGKQRFMIYPVCAECGQAPDAIEAFMEKQLTMRTVH